MTSIPLSAQVTEAIDNFVLEVGVPEVLQTPRRRRNFRDWLHRLASLSHQEHWFALCAAIFSDELDTGNSNQISGSERSLTQIQTRVVRAIISRVIHPFEGESPRVVSAYARRQVAPSHNSLTLLAILDARMSEFFITREPDNRSTPNATVLDAPLPLLQPQNYVTIPSPQTLHQQEVELHVTSRDPIETDLSFHLNGNRPTHHTNQDVPTIQQQLVEAEEPHRTRPDSFQRSAAISSPLPISENQIEQNLGPDTSFSTRMNSNISLEATRPPTIPNLLNQPSSEAEDTTSVTTNFGA